MAKDAFETWYVEGLQAVHSAADQGRAASGSEHARNAQPEIRELMEGGAKVFGKHAETLGQLLQRAGGAPGGTPNAFWDGIQKGSQQMIGAAGDAAVRDASVVAAAQIATHYFIAAYGTLASNAKHLGRDADAKALAGMADEMKAADGRMTEFAEGTANKRASAGA